MIEADGMSRCRTFCGVVDLQTAWDRNGYLGWGFCGSLFFGEVVVMGMGIFNVVEYLRDYGGFSSISVFLSILGYYSCILGIHFRIFGGKNVLRKLQQYAIDL